MQFKVSSTSGGKKGESKGAHSDIRKGESDVRSVGWSSKVDLNISRKISDRESCGESRKRKGKKARGKKGQVKEGRLPEPGKLGTGGGQINGGEKPKVPFIFESLGKMKRLGGKRNRW